MRLASLTGSNKLYSLSGWDNQYWWYAEQYYSDGSMAHTIVGEHDAPFNTSVHPAYDAEFLLEHLPNLTQRLHDGEYRAIWQDQAKTKRIIGRSKANATDALCYLAIELIKAGVLKP